TVDTLTTIRKLKEHGVEVYFESQGIYSFDSKCEFVISVMASIAQEESRNISENVTWGKRKRAAEGDVYLPYGQFLGYKKGEDGLPEIDREGAELSLMLCQMYLDGHTYLGIADRLTELGIPTPGGKRVWRTSTVRSILFNEKRRGDALLLKTYTVDYLTHRIKRNDGEVEQYFVENSHPAIFSRELAAMLDMEKERRERIGNSYNGAGVFSSRIVCGDCGGIYGPKVWSSNTKYRRTIWRCNRKYVSGEKVCRTPHLTEEEIVHAFLVALKKQAENLSYIRESLENVIAGALDTSLLEKKHRDLEERLQGAMSKEQALIVRNAREVMDQDEFRNEQHTLADRCAELTAEMDAVGRKISEMRGRKAAIDEYLATLEQVEELPIEFSRRLWNMTVDTLTVYEGKKLVFRWKDGATSKL
ncbi:recombinase family protein, partial [bacterium]|nr:recombinase family protein [bacterium]